MTDSVIVPPWHGRSDKRKTRIETEKWRTLVRKSSIYEAGKQSDQLVNRMPKFIMNAHRRKGSMNIIKFGLVVTLLVVPLVKVPCALAASYQAVDISTIKGSGISDVSSSGVYVGQTTARMQVPCYYEDGTPAGTIWDDVYHAAFWKDGNVRDLDPSGECSGTSAINEMGVAVGFIMHGSMGRYRWAHYHGFVWQNDTMTEFEAPGYLTTEPYDINVHNQVVGEYSCYIDETGESNGSHHAFLWDDNQFSEIGLDIARGINDDGVVVGEKDGCAYTWKDGVATLLDSRFSTAYHINNRGQIIGWIMDVTDHGVIDRHVMWDNGNIIDITGLDGASLDLCALNNVGQVVGSAQVADGSWHAFVWQNGVMTDLGIGNANCINDDGVIFGKLGGPLGHAVMWVPVAEHSSLLALLVGIAGLGETMRRRTR